MKGGFSRFEAVDDREKEKETYVSQTLARQTWWYGAGQPRTVVSSKYKFGPPNCVKKTDGGAYLGAKQK